MGDKDGDKTEEHVHHPKGQLLLRSNQWLPDETFSLGLSNLPMVPGKQNLTFLLICEILMFWYNVYEKHSMD